MTLTPLFDRVALTRSEASETSASGLYLAPNAREKSNFATVVAAGPGRVGDDGVLVPTTVEVGQLVLIGKWAGDVVQVDGVEMLIVRESDILAVVD
jgi:chaperonin GroES